MVNVYIDEITPCLKDNLSGEIVQTEVIRLTRKSFLEKYNSKNHWYVDWHKLVDDNEVYALVIKGSVDIQGLVAVRPDDEMSCEFVTWMVSAPHNNPLLTDSPKYSGVGGHLFAIAVDKSFDNGYEGVICGFAANQKLLQHYVDRLYAEPICMLHEYQFMIDEESARLIREEYTYEWTTEQI